MPSHEDVKTRAWKTLKRQIAGSMQFVCTHVGVSNPTLMVSKATLEVKREVAPWVELQTVAFPQEGILSYPNGEALPGEALKLGADVIGAIPHFGFTREYGVESPHITFRLTQKYGRSLGIHCDEIDNEQSRFIETVAASALEAGIEARVTVSHTTVVHFYNGAYISRLLRLPKLSGVNFVANPLVSIRLWNRFDDYSRRRGATRVKEPMAAGVDVCFGHDDVLDSWYPLGIGNMLQVLHMGLHVCQLMGYQQISNGLRLITDNSACIFGLEDYGIINGSPANLIILSVENGFEATRCQVPVCWSIRQRRVIVTTQLAQTWIQTDRGGEGLFFMGNSPLADAKGPKVQ